MEKISFFYFSYLFSRRIHQHCHGYFLKPKSVIRLLRANTLSICQKIKDVIIITLMTDLG